MIKYKKDKNRKKTKRNVSKKNNKRTFKRILKGGGQIPFIEPKNELPTAEVKQVELLPINNTTKNTNTDNKKGGVGSSWGNLNMSIFPMDKSQLDQFKRDVNSPMDCVVNALQILGFLDSNSANIFRLTCVGSSGITSRQVEKIFSLRTNKKFVFHSTKNVNEFFSYVNKIPKNNVIFCGITMRDNCGKHVFLIGRDENEKIVKIDPHSKTPICFLDTDIACIEEFSGNTVEYYMLFNYEGELTNQEKVEMGIAVPEINMNMDIDL